MTPIHTIPFPTSPDRQYPAVLKTSSPCSVDRLVLLSQGGHRQGDFSRSTPRGFAQRGGGLHGSSAPSQALLRIRAERLRSFPHSSGKRATDSGPKNHADSQTFRYASQDRTDHWHRSGS